MVNYQKNDIVHSDVLVIGTGIAGAMTAFLAARLGLQVIIINKEKEAEESSTRYAQGGIVGKGDLDSPVILASDIIKAGDDICNDPAVSMLSWEGPKLLEKILIDEIKVEFDRGEDGEYDLTMEGAHSRRRILHYKDMTGKVIEERLVEALRNEKNVQLLTENMAIDLITTPHHSIDPKSVYKEKKCLGAYVLDIQERRVKRFFAKAVVLATGGVGRIYLHTTNPPCAKGDGLAMASRAGATVINAEYIQFHPTALFIRDEERFLISESLRGEGARLKNRRGDFFMKRYDPDLLDLAPRDVTARAICEEMEREGDNYVLLDITKASGSTVDVAERFPQVYQKCIENGIDPSRDPIPVVPAAHYFCGGIKVNLNGETDLANLYAVGEVSCTGVHGANRLASVSLLEGLVWGFRAANHISKAVEGVPEINYREIPIWEGVEEEEVDPILISQDMLNIRTTMWNYAGIIRTEKRLKRARSDMDYLNHRISKFYRESHLTKGLIELRNAVLVAGIIINRALKNRISKGCHFRKD